MNRLQAAEKTVGMLPLNEPCISLVDVLFDGKIQDIYWVPNDYYNQLKKLIKLSDLGSVEVKLGRRNKLTETFTITIIDPNS